VEIFSFDRNLREGGLTPRNAVCGVAVAQNCRTSMMDRLMDRKIVSQARQDKRVALIAILILLLCLSPMFWELASAVRQFL
jgi:hypothetical protein